jgi:hypothetical protein
MRDHIRHAIVGTCEVNDGFLEGLRSFHVLRVGELV